MSLNRINKKLFELRKRSKELSIGIINCRVNYLNDIEQPKKLYDLEIESDKVIENIKILELQKEIIKRGKII